MRSRILAVLISVVFMLVGGIAVAHATAGDSAGYGSVTIQNVYVWSSSGVLADPEVRTIDVDCPANSKVLIGYGTLTTITANTLSFSFHQGSALDYDTWRVDFPLGLGSRYTIQVSASCY